MNKIFFTILPLTIILTACHSSANRTPLSIKNIVEKDLKEISGITASGNELWAITDKPHADVYKLNEKGEVIEKVEVTNTDATDVEAVTADDDYVYIGDVGDNNGDRVERKIIKVAKKDIGKGKEAKVTGELIEFVFDNEGSIDNKKDNNFDCESLISYKDSLFVFTKDREDNETRLYAIPKTPGKFSARFIDSYNSKGLITDAAINPVNGELALIGYHKGHKFPFIILFNNYEGNNFFTGDEQKIKLADKPWDWQLEGITYGPGDMVYFSCEGTKEVKATFYGIKRSRLLELDKKKRAKSDENDDSEPELSTKGHIKK